MTRAIRSALCFLLTATIPILTAQTPPSSPTPGTGTTPGGSRTPTSPSNPGSNTGNLPGTQSPGTQPQLPTTPTFLYGKVAMADGSPLPNGISIVRVCMSSQRTIAFTDSKGQFSYQTGMMDDSLMLGDASDAGGGPFYNPRNTTSNGRGAGADQQAAMSNCELKADLPGFRSDVIPMERLRAFGNSDIGTIVLRRLANVEGTSVSGTMFSAPSDARKSYEKGLQALQKGKLPESQKDLEKAVASYPKFANAWLALGRARLRQNQTEPARDAFHKALEADSKLVEAQVELGIMAARDKAWRDAVQYLDAALKLDPVDFPQIWFTDAVANFNSGNFDSAEKMAREALRVDPTHKNPQVDQLLGMTLAQKKDYAGAAEELRTYLKLAPTAADAASVKTQLERIEALAAAKPQ
jgi:tetratricopeptide (TPR) repeat protein